MGKGATIEHEGIVLELTTATSVRVRIVQASACAACHAKGMCMAAESKEKVIDCLCVEPLQVGDKVRVQVAERLGWKAVLLAFVLPFVLLISVAAGLSLTTLSEGVIGLIALATLVPYYICIWAARKRIKKDFAFWAIKQESNC